MIIIDSFIFYNELEMLSYRLNLLDPFVDYFVICESRYTFAGTPKECIYELNKETFKKFHSKMIHIIVDEFPYIKPNIDFQLNHQWMNEAYQRDKLKVGIETLKCSNEDIILISDIDEIINPDLLINLKKGHINSMDSMDSIYALEMDMYYYNLTCRHKTKWYHGKLLNYASYFSLKMSFTDIRSQRKSKIITNAGWHLSYFGNAEFIQNKIKEFSHQEFNNDNFTTLELINHHLQNNTDLFKRCNIEYETIPIHMNKNLPPLYNIYLQSFI